MWGLSMIFFIYLYVLLVMGLWVEATPIETSIGVGSMFFFIPMYISIRICEYFFTDKINMDTNNDN